MLPLPPRNRRVSFVSKIAGKKSSSAPSPVNTTVTSLLLIFARKPCRQRRGGVGTWARQSSRPFFPMAVFQIGRFVQVQTRCVPTARSGVKVSAMGRALVERGRPLKGDGKKVRSCAVGPVCAAVAAGWWKSRGPPLSQMAHRNVRHQLLAPPIVAANHPALPWLLQSTAELGAASFFSHIGFARLNVCHCAHCITCPGSSLRMPSHQRVRSGHVVQAEIAVQPGHAIDCVGTSGWAKMHFSSDPK